MLQCATGQLYSGYTTNLKRRLREHNTGRGGKFTRSRTPVKLVYSEQYTTRKEAMLRETSLKRMPRIKKIELAGEHGKARFWRVKNLFWNTPARFLTNFRSFPLKPPVAYRSCIVLSFWHFLHTLERLERGRTPFQLKERVRTYWSGITSPCFRAKIVFLIIFYQWFWSV